MDIFRQASLNLEQISGGLLAERVIGRSGMATIKILFEPPVNYWCKKCFFYKSHPTKNPKCGTGVACSRLNTNRYILLIDNLCIFSILRLNKDNAK